MRGLKGKVQLVGYGGGAIAFQGIASGERYGTVMQAPATEGRLGVQHVHRRDPERHAGAGRRRPEGPARRRGRHQGQRPDLPAARGVAGLNRGAVGRMTPDGVHLDIRGIGKSFGGTRALDDVTIEIAAGSVHAFVGENGAGKSTLGKIVAGVIPPDQGQLAVRGEPVVFRLAARGTRTGASPSSPRRSPSSRSARSRENVFLGTEPRRFGFVRRGERSGPVRPRSSHDTGFEVPADAIVGALPIAKQQQVEILRALARDAELIVFDEPTASLSAAEVERFHEIVRRRSAERPDRDLSSRTS